MLVANAYPSEQEITKGLKPKEGVKSLSAILDLAKRATGILVNEPVSRCRFAGLIFLDDGLTRLAHFPVAKVKVADQVVSRAEIYESLGILSRVMPRDEYPISYEVGYSDGNVPAVIKELVTALSRYLYSGSDDFRSEIIGLVKVARLVRKKVRDRRNDYQVDREGSRQGLTCHSPS